VKRVAAEWLIGLLAIAAGLGLTELWKRLLRRLPEERARLGEALESGGPDDA
jgi:hypothetical protein